MLYNKLSYYESLDYRIKSKEFVNHVVRHYSRHKRPGFQQAQ